VINEKDEKVQQTIIIVKNMKEDVELEEKIKKQKEEAEGLKKRIQFDEKFFDKKFKEEFRKYIKNNYKDIALENFDLLEDINKYKILKITERKGAKGAIIQKYFNKSSVTLLISNEESQELITAMKNREFEAKEDFGDIEKAIKLAFIKDSFVNFVEYYKIKLSILSYEEGLVKMLEDKKGYQQFYEFLQSEYMEDILNFYKEARNFEKNFKSVEQSKEKAIEIIDTYVDEKSKKSLNIPQKETEYLRKLVNEDRIDKELFYRSLVGQYFLITNDSLLRFSMTPDGKDLIKKYKVPPYYKE
jgi:hypothetical protein